MKHWSLMALAAGLLVSCSGNAPVTGGVKKAKVLSSISQPNLQTCPLIIGDYVAFKGSDFGLATDWTSGANKVIFTTNVPAVMVELTQASDPATLLVKVPAGAISGPVVLEVGGVKSDPVEVIINSFGATRAQPQTAVPDCVYPPKP
jgi:hypothetical protein